MIKFLDNFLFGLAFGLGWACVQVLVRFLQWILAHT